MSDAVSEELAFPFWYRYYGGLFGARNLFLITYAGKAKAFAGVSLGGLIELPVGYSDEVRAAAITRFVATLLSCYDLIIRVDTDEFLVVDPGSAVTLAAYMETMADPYLTARGFDVIQLPDEQALAAPEGVPLLRDRSWAYPNTALNKTCVVQVPLQWSMGFHWASVFPSFGPLFMLHTKRIDVGWQMAHLSRMTSDFSSHTEVSSHLRTYYAPDEAQVLAYHEAVARRPRLLGTAAWYRHQLQAGFVADVRYSPADGLYHGQYGHEEVLCQIPREWKRAL